MATELNCNERTIQRAIKKFTALSLIKRNTPPKKFIRGAHYISISDSFYERTKDFFESEKNVTHKEKNVGPIKINISKTISLSLNNSSKKTKTNINRDAVGFISDEILKINLRGLDQKIGLTHLDLQNLKNRINWSISDLQISIDNYSEALELGLFTPTKLSAKDTLLSILSGSKNTGKAPRMFGKMTAKKEVVVSETIRNNQMKIEEENKEKERLFKEEKKEKLENNWLSLADKTKAEYLTNNNNNLSLAIENAYKDLLNNSEFSLTSIVSLMEALDPTPNESIKKKNRITFKLEWNWRPFQRPRSISSKFEKIGNFEN